jgi:type I pantothenate kinase
MGPVTAGTRAQISPFTAFDRESWRALAAGTELPLSATDLRSLASLGDPIDLDEVTTVYLPLARLLHLHVTASRRLWAAQTEFLGQRTAKVPFVIAVAGSVAVGKSTTARLLRALLAAAPDTPRVDLVTTDGFLLPNAVLEERGILGRKGFPESYDRRALLAAAPDTPRVDLVTTDGFLLPNAVLEERGILGRKGFPESYDRRALLRFLADVKSGRPEVSAPTYSHQSYDVVPGERQVVDSPDVLVLEGLNVLQAGGGRSDGRVPEVFLSDFFDFSVYVDAAEPDIQQWYVDRFLALRRTAFQDSTAYFHRFADLTDAEAVRTARDIWTSVNGPNLRRNIAPSRSRARLVLQKSADHSVRRVLLRKL